MKHLRPLNWLKKASESTITITFVLVVILTGLGWQISRWYEERLIAEEKLNLSLSLPGYANSVSNALYRRLSIVSGVTAFVELNPDVEYLDQTYDRFVSNLMEDVSGIRTMAVFPNGIGTFVYPVKGNEAVMGHDLYNDPRAVVQRDVWLAIETGQLILSDPYELVQGGKGLVARQAIFNDGQVWGLVGMAIEIAACLDEAGLDKLANDLRVAFYSPDGELVYGEEGVHSKDPVVIHLDVAERQWTLEFAPALGWPDMVSNRVDVVRGFEMLVALLVIAMAVSVLQNRDSLRSQVAARTAALDAELEERRQIRLSLERERSLWIRVADTSPVAISVIDRNGQLIFVNAQYERLMQIDRSKLLGRHYREQPVWFTPMDHQGASSTNGDPFERVMHSLRPVYGARVTLVLLNNVKKTLQLNLAPLLDEAGRFDGMITAVEDETLQYEAAEQMRESEERYRRLFDLTPDTVFVQVDSRFALINPAGLKLFGASRPEEILGKPVLDFVHPNDRAEARARIHLLNEAHQEPPLLEERFLRMDGSVVVAEVVAKPFVFRGKNGALVLVHDVTQRKRSEEELRLLVAETARRARELEHIVDVSAAMRDAATLTEVAWQAVDRSMPAVGCVGCALFLLEDEGLILIAANGHTPVKQSPLVIPLSEELLWSVVRYGHSVMTPPGKSLPARQPLCNQLLGGAAGGSLMTPLKGGVAVHGLILWMFEEEPEDWNERSRIAEGLADIISNAVHRVKVNQALEELVAGRSMELETIFQVTSDASESPNLTLALERALSIVLQTVGSNAGLVMLVEEDGEYIDVCVEQGMPPEVLQRIRRQRIVGSLEEGVILRGEPVILSDLASNPLAGWAARPDERVPFAALPMRAHGRVMGTLNIHRPGGRDFNLNEITLLSFIADHLGLIVEMDQLRDQAEQGAVLNERTRLARELHDSVTQSLYSASLFADGGKLYAEQGNLDKAHEYLERLGVITHQALKEMRLMVYELRYADLETKGLDELLRERLQSVEQRSGVTATLETDGNPYYSTLANGALFWSAMEALNNTLKHANASIVKIRCWINDGWIHLNIEDNGCGFDYNAEIHRGGMGLQTMQERLTAIGGTVQLFSEPNKGTRVELLAPYHQ